MFSEMSEMKLNQNEKPPLQFPHQTVCFPFIKTEVCGLEHMWLLTVLVMRWEDIRLVSSQGETAVATSKVSYSSWFLRNDVILKLKVWRSQVRQFHVYTCYKSEERWGAGCYKLQFFASPQDILVVKTERAPHWASPQSCFTSSNCFLINITDTRTSLASVFLQFEMWKRMWKRIFAHNTPPTQA